MTVRAEPRFGSLKFNRVADLQPIWCPRPLWSSGKHRGNNMAEHVSPEFHAEIIIALFNDYNDLRKVGERAKLLLSRASAAHLDAVGRSLPDNLINLLPRHTRRAA
jgi:hypothetical protein